MELVQNRGRRAELISPRNDHPVPTFFQTDLYPHNY